MPPSFLADPPADAESFVGKPSLWARIQRVEVKGTLVAAPARYVKEQFGPEGFQLVEAALSPGARSIFTSPPLAFEWTRYEPMLEIDYFITKLVMNNRMEQMQHFGGEIAGYDLPLAYRVLFKVGSPGFVVGRLGSAYRAYLRPGTVVVVGGDRSATIRLEGSCLPLYMCKYGIAGWIQSALKLSGGKGIHVEHTGCLHLGGECVWEATWH